MFIFVAKTDDFLDKYLSRKRSGNGRKRRILEVMLAFIFNLFSFFPKDKVKNESLQTGGHYFAVSNHKPF
jgi:hypothetical protein